MLEVLLSILFIAVLKNWMLVMNSMVVYFLIILFKFYDSGEYNLKLIMYLLSIWLVVMMMMSVDLSSKSLDLLMIFIILLFSLLLAFYSESMIGFYLGFEMSVFPVLLIIYGWGYQPDRLEAGFYMILYTVIFSLPFLVGIFYCYYMKTMNFFVYFMFMMAFFAKLPMFGFHFWLPRAHVEAPVFGSMILAGVMLKLGGYGIIKVCLSSGDMFYVYSNVIIMISILGGVYLSGNCFVQSDMKMLVAYSSVVHMSIVLSGLLTMTEMGINGSIYLMVGHGLCSSGLFCILGFTYNRTSTRSIYLNKGILILMPTCSLWWFLFCSSNLSFPPCLNMPGEILLFISILSWEKMTYVFMGLFGLISSMYSIYLFSFTQQGQNSIYFSFNNFTLSESLLMSLHWIPLNILILDLSMMNF
uniref:NADH-ubiquinone oxidoreductase chain 4 n=1 Tax=Trioza anthrisci TaxID=2023874 RepID=A0A344A2T1_9HEMI|nr:NADH dehydrogenase subunit 4 [Trioza anthrisci]AWU49072.1 NADH dehydrogenase subunit 4 [Trioza anthrisci]